MHIVLIKFGSYLAWFMTSPGPSRLRLILAVGQCVWFFWKFVTHIALLRSKSNSAWFMTSHALNSLKQILAVCQFFGFLLVLFMQPVLINSGSNTAWFMTSHAFTESFRGDEILLRGVISLGVKFYTLQGDSYPPLGCNFLITEITVRIHPTVGKS